jgi:RNA polymerase sigma factor (sigma-70 family)
VIHYQETDCDLAKEYVVNMTYRLVAKKALAYLSKRHNAYDTEEYIQAGIIGICKAMQKFDPEKNDSFNPYALLWVRRYMNELYAKGISRTCSIPRNIAEQYVAGSLDTELSELIQVHSLSHVQLDGPAMGGHGDSDGGADKHQLIEDRTTDTADEAFDNIMFVEVQKILFEFPFDHDRYVVLGMSFGIFDFKQSSDQEIGDKLGISRRNVSLRRAKYLKQICERISTDCDCFNEEHYV